MLAWYSLSDLLREGITDAHYAPVIVDKDNGDVLILCVVADGNPPAPIKREYL